MDQEWQLDKAIWPLLSSSRIPDSLSLCSLCLQSPLDSLFHVGEKPDILLGTLQHAQSHSDVCDLCRLCSVYYSAIQRDGQYHKWIDHPQECGFSLYPPTRVRFHAITYRGREYWLAPMWHFYVFMGSMIRLWPYKIPSIHVPGCHEPVALVIQERRIAQGPFQLDTSTRDGQYLPARCYDAIMAGAESCHGTHTACDRDVTDPSRAMTFRLIDVHTKMVIPATGGEKYVALSYVWGRSARQTPRLFESLPETLPQTIADVISVVQNLGMQYVWIDAYCIDQSNESELSQAISNMGSVYESAFMTLCPFWADSRHGLHGVSIPFKSPQTYPLGRDHICWAYGRYHPLDRDITDTPWHNRAWVFQESMLARLRLCFLRGSVHLSCLKQKMNSLSYLRTCRHSRIPV